MSKFWEVRKIGDVWEIEDYIEGEATGRFLGKLKFVAGGREFIDVAEMQELEGGQVGITEDVFDAVCA